MRAARAPAPGGSTPSIPLARRRRVAAHSGRNTTRSSTTKSSAAFRRSFKLPVHATRPTHVTANFGRRPHDAVIFEGVETLADADTTEAAAKHIGRRRGRVPIRHEAAIGGGPYWYARHGDAGSREAQCDPGVDATRRGEIEQRDDVREPSRGRCHETTRDQPDLGEHLVPDPGDVAFIHGSPPTTPRAASANFLV